jgi:hypothetical protein
MVKFNQVHSHHRFEFLHKEVEKQLGVKISGRNPVDKTMVWLGDEIDVYWECHDGVRDFVEKESCARLYKLIQTFKPTKPFLYVKPNFSPTRSAGHVALAAEHGGRLVTCAKWSYYPHYQWMFDNRFELRRRRNIQRKLAFFGATNDKIRYDTTNYIEHPFEHGISRSDARNMFGVHLDVVLEENVAAPGTRMELVKMIEAGTNTPVAVFEGLGPSAYANAVLETQLVFQPHGVGPRHAIYESMMLGVPSIIPECSYLDSVTRNFNLIINEDVTQEDCEHIKLMFDKPDRDTMLDIAFEENMTPEAIVRSVLNEVRESI